MLENQVTPLFVARRVLKARTLLEVGRSPYTLRGWAILDRWAMNSPAALQALEAHGIEALKARLLDQQELESRAMLDYCELIDNGTPELEILALAGIDTELAALVRAGWTGAAKRIAAAGDDELRLGELL